MPPITGAPTTAGNVTFEADDVYDQRDAQGFIKLQALRLRIRRELDRT